MSTQPFQISQEEWQEIFDLKDIKEMWGFLDDDITAKDFSEMVYGVKFDFVSGCPGYVGDLYILQGDALGEPVVLVRDWDKKLKLSV